MQYFVIALSKAFLSHVIKTRIRTFMGELDDLLGGALESLVHLILRE